ncbi:MAG TPA: ABC transporter six-transmembrane domain-containing protein [Terricaulis sp.]|nr:ABC transporter six-transmembrane domain-containing protein [Terricaulis sp.]HRP10175.1 ABC transporter six-transmembrane domain-containing protein [Terricaulis sp.]
MSASGELSHASVARRYKGLIAGTLALLALENIFAVLEPWLLGRALDGLIAGDFTALGIFLIAAIGALGVGVGRRLYDTRAYGRIFRESAGEVAGREFEANAPTAQTAARVQFVQEFTDFFELMLPAALVSVFMLFGSVVMLSIISPRLGAVTALVAVLICAIFFFSRGRIEKLNSAFNDEAERQVEILTNRDAQAFGAHLFSLVRWRIRLSDLEARNFGGVFLLTFSLTAAAAWILIRLEEKSVGDTFAALAYVLQFSQAVVVLPYTYQQFIRTQEIGARISKGAPDGQAGG